MVESDAVAAVVEGRERRRGERWLMGSRGSDFAKGVSSGRWEGGFLEGGFVAVVVYFFRWCGRIGRCGGCGGGEGAALRGAMVDGVKRERLREGRQLRTMGGGVGGRRVWPRRAGRKYLLCENFVWIRTGDVLRKKYIMLTKFYFVHT